MTMKTNADGTIEVRVVLTIQVDPNAWAATMMNERPEELLQKEVRRDVKKRVRDRIAEWPMDPSDYDEDTNVPIGEVYTQGLYDHLTPRS